MASDDRGHAPVLLDQAIGLLRPRPGGTYVDCTVGLGGHTAALLDAGAGRVIGIDRDEAALARTRNRLGSAGDRLLLVHADYRELPHVLSECGVNEIEGILADLGVSSLQLDDPARGFSFRAEGPLDMRMNRLEGPTAADLIRDADEVALADVIHGYGEERHARRIARAIVRARERQPITTTTELAAVVRRAAGRGWQRIDPATRTFQALRIWVNRELEDLEPFIVEAVRVLSAGGRLVVIAFHSLEDRIVKHAFRRMSASPAADELRGSELPRPSPPMRAARASSRALGPQDLPPARLRAVPPSVGQPMASARPHRHSEHRSVIRILTRRPIVPDDAEIRRNPRSRSARLRALERVA